MSYKLNDKMSRVILSDYRLLQVMSRFGLSLGFGEKTVSDVCEESNIDAPTFLDIVNFLNDGNASAERIKSLDIPSVMVYLKNAHSYFLDFQLPSIRRKLIESIDCSVNNELAFMILKFYDAYVEGVRKHMNYENETVFNYVEGLMKGQIQKDFRIQVFASHHDDIEQKLAELKKIIITYYPTRSDNNLFNAVLFDIFTSEEDLAQHNAIENSLFIPAVRLLERHQNKTIVAKKNNATEVQPLSDREKEIIAYVAKGMANKEIAETLFISIHTVLTHRKNICRKLDIHSTAELTIYAIVNKLVKLDSPEGITISMEN